MPAQSLGGAHRGRLVSVLMLKKKEKKRKSFDAIRPDTNTGAVWIVTIFAMCCHIIFTTFDILVLAELLKLLATL